MSKDEWINMNIKFIRNGDLATKSNAGSQMQLRKSKRSCVNH